MSGGVTQLGKEQEPERPVTAVAIDGNSVMAAVVSSRDEQPFIHAAKAIELPELAEHVRRVAHPIFMDVDYLELASSTELTRALSELFSDPTFSHPVIGVIPGECVRTWAERGANLQEAQRSRLQRGIQSLMSANPYAYPQVFGYSEREQESGSETAIWSARLGDILELGNSLREHSNKFLGFVSGKTALASFSRLFDQNASVPISIVDVGKMRTVYVGTFQEKLSFSHSIPVGMVRDDIHYFSALSPLVARASQMKNELGGLFFPPDVTPSPLFDPSVSTPRIECTRFSIQIARFVYRVVQDVWEGIAQPDEVRFYLTGLPRRLAGFRQYVEFKAGVRFSLLGEMPPSGVGKSEGIDWETVADCLPAVAAGVAYHQRSRSRFGMMLKGRRPERIGSANRIVDKIRPEEVFVLDRPVIKRRRVSIPTPPPADLSNK